MSLNSVFDLLVLGKANLSIIATSAMAKKGSISEASEPEHQEPSLLPVFLRLLAGLQRLEGCHPEVPRGLSHSS